MLINNTWNSAGWGWGITYLMARVWVALVAAVIVIAGAGGASATGDTRCGETTWTLWAGQTIDAGTVTVWNDATNLYVEYKLGAGTEFRELHLWVGSDLGDMPAAGNGAPINGQFPYKIDLTGTGTTTHVFVIPLADVVYNQPTCGATLYVVAHAEVKVNGNWETGYGGDTPVNVGARNRWYYYGTYTVDCDCGNGGTGDVCETAYGFGTHVFTPASRPRSNPDGLGTLGLNNGRWGWAIRIPAGTNNYSSTIWSGAGQNNTNRGTDVGTLSISRTGAGIVTVSFDLGSNTMSETHIHLAATAPTTIAPGRYGHIAYFDPQTSTYSHSAGTFTGDFWVVAHAVVCR